MWCSCCMMPRGRAAQLQCSSSGSSTHSGHAGRCERRLTQHTPLPPLLQPLSVQRAASGTRASARPHIACLCSAAVIPGVPRRQLSKHVLPGLPATQLHVMLLWPCHQLPLHGGPPHMSGGATSNDVCCDRPEGRERAAPCRCVTQQHGCSYPLQLPVRWPAVHHIPEPITSLLDLHSQSCVPTNS